MWKEIFGDKLVSKDGEVDTETALSGKEAVGVYFSAHWCPPCRGFTPVFAKKYEEIKAEKNFEVVFVSSDSDEAAGVSYYGEQPWLMLPYADRDRKQKLGEKYNCSGIPHLVILNGENAEVITENGRAGISGPNHIKDFPYHPKPMYDVSESMDGIDGGVSFLLCQNYAPKETQDANSETLLDVAVNNKGLFHRFFTVNTSADPCKFIRTQTGQMYAETKPDFEVTLTKSVDCPYKEYGCDRCGGYKTCEQRYFNPQNQYDCCEECWAKPWAQPSDADKIPTMVAVDLKTNEYLLPADDAKEFSKENLEKFGQDIKDGKAKRTKLGEK